MSAWFETLIVFLIAVSGIFFGIIFSRFRSPHWLWGYFISVVLIAILIVSRFSSFFAFEKPFCWLVAGRVRFVLFAVAVTMGLTSPLSRLPRKGQRVLTCVLMLFFVIWFSLLPFLMPALMKGRLLGLSTRMDLDGVCLQSTSYTCAPAAAVTALERLGFSASEGQLAVLSHTSPIAGTLPFCLSDALRSRYGPEGLECEYRHFDSIDELKKAGLTLAVVSDSFLFDHCVAVLEVSEKRVCFADPAFGKVLMSREQFQKIWRFSGITLKRNVASSM